MEAIRDGRFQACLRARGRDMRTDGIGDPHSFLPAWLQPRPTRAAGQG